LLFGLKGSVRKEQKGSAKAYFEQHFEAIQGSGRELGEKFKKKHVRIALVRDSTGGKAREEDS
jgi:hypothetical protein